MCSLAASILCSVDVERERERERVVGGGEMREYVCERRVREERRMSTHTYRRGSRQATRAKNKQTRTQ